MKVELLHHISEENAAIVRKIHKSQIGFVPADLKHHNSGRDRSLPRSTYPLRGTTHESFVDSLLPEIFMNLISSAMGHG